MSHEKEQPEALSSIEPPEPTKEQMRKMREREAQKILPELVKVLKRLAEKAQENGVQARIIILGPDSKHSEAVMGKIIITNGKGEVIMTLDHELLLEALNETT